MFRHLTIATFCLLLLLSSVGRATHIVGGEMHYDHLGNDSFKISLYLYVDCINGSPGALAIDSIASIGIFYGHAPIMPAYKTLTVNRQNPERVKGINYNCLVPPTNVCVDRYSYVARVKLPDNPKGWIIAYQRCCRNRTVLNVFNQNSTGTTVWTTIPERKKHGNNSSARFVKLPPNFLCKDKPFSFNHVAKDPDGDSLVYRLCKPWAGASDLDPYPRPPGNPPYSRITLNNGYSVFNFMNGDPNLEIDRLTGKLTCTPRRLGQYVVGICVQEYRDGVFINSTTRDFQFNVIDCEFDVVSAFTFPEQECDRTVKFSNESEGAVKYRWNFGDPFASDDTSNLENPSYQYTRNGKHTVQLIAASDDCADTFYQEFFVEPDTGTFAGPDKRICTGESAVLGSSLHTIDTSHSYEWIPSDYLDDHTAVFPKAIPPNDIRYVLKKTFGYCYGYDTVEVVVGDPEVDFELEPLIECRNMTFRLINKSDGGEYSWKISPPDTILRREGGYVSFEKEGAVKFKLVSTLNGKCSDSLTKIFDVRRDTNGFAGPDTMICRGDSVQIGSPGPITSLNYYWSPGRLTNDSTAERPWVIPEFNTRFVLKRSAAYCTVYDTVQIDVDRPDPFFKLAYNAPCDGTSISLFNHSTNCVELLWDFGVAGLSTDTSTSMDSVSYSYPTNDDYVIRLQGISAFGCEYVYERPLHVEADTAFYAGPDSNLCLGNILQLGKNDTTSLAEFQWIPGDSVTDASIPNPFIEPKESQILVLLKKYPNCTFRDSVFLKVLNPRAGFSSDYDPHCDVFDMEVKNEASNFSGVLWDFGFESGRFQDSSKKVSIQFPGPGVYKVEQYTSKLHCADTSMRVVKVYLDTGATVIPDSVICLDDSAFLGIADTAGRATHKWFPADYLSSDTVSNPLSIPKRSIKYTYVRTFPKCEYSSTVSLRITDPDASFDAEFIPDCEGYYVEFTNLSSSAEDYRWSFSNGVQSESVNERQLFSFGELMNAQLAAIDAHCRDEAFISREIKSFDSIGITAPNIFTPNGDGYNDCFELSISELPDNCSNFELYIFNRWGEKVFRKELEDGKICWDGTTGKNDRPLAPGTYFYLIRMKGRTLQGSVLLSR